MDEIKVVPYIPDEDYDNPAMVVDFYEFTMANCLFLHGFKDTTLVFDMFFRKNPDNQGYSISAGQRKLTRFPLEGRHVCPAGGHCVLSPCADGAH